MGHIGVVFHLALLLLGNIKRVFDYIVALVKKLGRRFAVLVVPAIALAREERFGQIKGKVAGLERCKQIPVFLLAFGL